MALQLMIPPSVDPVSLIEMKTHLRIDYDMTEEDALVADHIAAAVEHAHQLTQRQVISARWQLVLDGWGNGQIIIPKGPLLRVVSITYVDLAGVTRTVPPTDYVVEASGDPTRIRPVFGRIWPADVVPQLGAIKVLFDAGDATPITVSGNAIAPALWPTLAVGDAVRLSNSGGSLPEPLVPRQTYYVAAVQSPGVYTLAASVGGAAITLLDSGQGLSYVGVVPAGLKSWLRLRVAALYEQRAEVEVLERGSVERMPFVDGLLDPYRVVLA